MQEKQIRNPRDYFQCPSQKAVEDIKQPQGKSHVVACICNFMKVRKPKKNKLAGLLLETHCLEVFCGNLFRSTLLCYL